MSLESDLAEVDAAISQALKAQRWKHGDDEAELPDLDKLREMKADLEKRIARKSRGPRVTGVRLGHS